MSDNVIPVGNTPLFEELVREYELRGKRFSSLLSPKGADNLQPARPLFVSAAEAIKSWSATAQEAGTRLKGLSLSLPLAKDTVAYRGIRIARVHPEIVETFDPVSLIEQSINPDLHIANLVKKFREDHPDVHPVHISLADNIDGTMTVTVKGGREQTDEDVNAEPRPIAVNTLSEVLRTNCDSIEESFNVRGEATVLPPVIKTGFQVRQEELAESLKDEMTIDPETIDPKYRSIGENTADVLYMKTSTWGSDEE